MFILGLLLGLGAGAGVLELLRRRRDHDREALFSFAAHELASPTTGVQLALRNLLQGVFGDVPAEQRRWLEVAQDQTAWLGGVAADVGDLAHLELGGRLRVSPGVFDLESAAKRSVEDASRLAQRWGVALALEAPSALPQAKSDPDRTSRVLWNIVIHALKFSAPKSSVRVSLSSMDSLVQAAVEWTPVDRGATPAELLDRFCVARGGKTLKISGVGLASAQEVIARCGGRLEGERRGERDVFVLSLPKA